MENLFLDDPFRSMIFTSTFSLFHSVFEISYACVMTPRANAANAHGYELGLSLVLNPLDGDCFLGTVIMGTSSHSASGYKIEWFGIGFNRSILVNR